MVEHYMVVGVGAFVLFRLKFLDHARAIGHEPNNESKLPIVKRIQIGQCMLKILNAIV